MAYFFKSICLALIEYRMQSSRHALPAPIRKSFALLCLLLLFFFGCGNAVKISDTSIFRLHQICRRRRRRKTCLVYFHNCKLFANLQKMLYSFIFVKTSTIIYKLWIVNDFCGLVSKGATVGANLL